MDRIAKLERIPPASSVESEGSITNYRTSFKLGKVAAASIFGNCDSLRLAAASVWQCPADWQEGDSGLRSNFSKGG
jgi:hypothetical protein